MRSLPLRLAGLAIALLPLAGCDRSSPPAEKPSSSSASDSTSDPASDPENALRRCGPVFTILHNPRGMSKSSWDLFNDAQILQAFQSAEYLGPYTSQLESPIAENYFSQDAIVILQSKQGIDLTIYHEQNKKPAQVFFLVTFIERSGIHLYRIPDPEKILGSSP